MATELERRIHALEPGTHACLIYDSPDDQFNAVLPFIRDGLERDHKCTYIVDDRTGAELVEALAAEGVDVMEAVQAGHMTIETKRETYHREGRFEPSAMLTVLGDLVDEARGNGHDGCRITGEMTWALGSEPGNDRLIEYEAKINALSAREDAIIICQYNRRRFPPEVIYDILRTHPVAIVGDRVYRNLFYERPEAILEGQPVGERVDWMLEQLEAAHQDIDRAARAEARLQAIIDSTEVAIVECDLEGTITRWSRGAERVYGYTAEEALGQPLAMLAPEGEAASVETNLARVRAGARLDQIEQPRQHRDGHLIDVSLSAAPIRDAEENLVACAIVSRDVTAERAAQEQLQESEAHFRTLAERVSDIIMLVDEDATIRYASPAVRRVLGYHPESLVDRNAFDLVHPEDLPAVRAAYREALTDPTADSLVTYRVRHADGSWRFLESTGRLEGADAGAGGLVISSRDVTERVELQAQLQQAQKMEAVGQLTGGVAHDFNNLLTAIQGYASMTRNDLPDDSPHTVALDEILKAVDRAAAVTRKLLSFSRKADPQVEWICVNDAIREMTAMLERLLPEYITLEIELGQALPKVRFSRGLLEQILLNLVMNAKDAVDPPGRVEIRSAPGVTDDHRPAVVIDVSDTGAGIPPEIRDRIFEPFFTTKPEDRGTGLGLATVYGILSEAGGDIAFETAPGLGTTFRVTLPVHEDANGRDSTAEQDPATDPAEEPVTTSGRATILVVEDEPGVRSLARKILEREGYRVLVAGTGEEARRIVEAHPDEIELCLSDVRLPDTLGPALQDRLHEIEPGLPFLFMSGDITGAADFTGELLEKPFTPDEVRQRVAQALAAVREGRER